jgi:hypothetical protein
MPSRKQSGSPRKRPVKRLLDNVLPKTSTKKAKHEDPTLGSQVISGAATVVTSTTTTTTYTRDQGQQAQEVS